MAMRRAGLAALAIVASIAFVSEMSRFAASAQNRNSGLLTVSARVYDRKQLLSPPALPDNALKGRAVWLQRCAYCHDGVGQPTYKTLGPWIGAETVESIGEDDVRGIIAAGSSRMPGFRYGLQSEQVNDLIAFLKTVQSDQKPTPEQLAGAQTATGSSE